MANAREYAGTIKIEGNSYPNFPGIAVAYAELVADDKIPSCEFMQLAARRFLDMHKAALAGTAEWYFCPHSAIEPCAFIETLHHVKGVLAGETIHLEPWQVFIIVAIYGFRWSDTGYRVVTDVILEVTRKSGKSLLVAGISLYELAVNADAGDDVFIIAPTEALANKVMEPMQKMVDKNDDLREWFGMTYKIGQLNVASTDSYAVTLSSAGKKQDGHDPKVVVADEFHSLPASIFNVMKSSQGARPESLFIKIGSAGYDAFGVGWDERNLAIEVLEGKRSKPEMFAAIYTIDEQDIGNWTSERVIRKANPNYGVSLDRRKVKQEINGIYETPRNKNEVLRTRFNVWGLGERKLISHVQWEGCLAEGLTLEMLEGRRCYAGVDLASRNDMAAKGLLFEVDDILYVFARHYVPEIGPWREDEEIRDQYEAWIEEGHLATTPGSFHTYDLILDDIVSDCDRFDVQTIAVDDREANWLMGELTKKALPVISIRKNATNFSDPTKDIQARAVGKVKGVAHDGNPVLAWNVNNTIGAVNTADLLLPKKPAPESNMKIDGFDALVQANACRLAAAEQKSGSKPSASVARGIREHEEAE